MNHSSTPDACGERHAIGGHRRRRRGTSMLCDRHQRLRLPPSCSCRRHCGKATARCVWTQRTPPIWSHSPQCAECDHVGGRAWVRPVRRRRLPQFCGIERGRFRRMPDGDRRTRRETSLRVGDRARCRCTCIVLCENGKFCTALFSASYSAKAKAACAQSVYGSAISVLLAVA